MRKRKGGTKRQFPFKGTGEEKGLDSENSERATVASVPVRSAASYSPVRKKAKGLMGKTVNFGVGGSRYSQMVVRQTSSKPVKKLVIKGFTSIPSLPKDFTERTWTNLETAVVAIHGEKEVHESKEALYAAVRNLCTQGSAATVYQRLRGLCDKQTARIAAKLSSLAKKSYASSTAKTGREDEDGFLHGVAKAWKEHCRQMQMIRNIFLYLDRTFVIQRANPSGLVSTRTEERRKSGPTPIEGVEGGYEGEESDGESSDFRSLWDMGLRLFRKHVLGLGTLVQTRTTDGVLALIRSEREGEAVDRALLHCLVRMYSAVDLYSSLEERILEQTVEYYSAEGAEKISSSTLPEFLSHCKRRLADERERAEFYLEVATVEPLLARIDRSLVEAHYETILRIGVMKLFTDERTEDLSILHMLFSRISKLRELSKCFNAYIRNAGVKLISRPEKDIQLIEELLLFKSSCDAIVSRAFGSGDEFFTALKAGFEFFLNKVQNKPAELMARFVDSKLKAGNKASSDAEVESLLDRVMVLFRFVQSKDVFQAFFRTDLAKRLLLGKSSSMDLEKLMIAKLKQECGASFTSKLEGMFTDMNISKEIMTAFKQDLCSEELDLDLTVHVLTMGVWPSYATVEVTLPPDLLKVQNTFKAYYMRKYNGRRLTWQNSMGHCVILANFPKGRKELAVSQYQALVLLLFNSSSVLTFSQVEEATKIDRVELQTTLQSLACGKVRVLRKNPAGREVTPNDKFALNGGFTHPRYRVKINQIQMKETEQERDKTNEGIFVERQLQVDAAIVRIMKTRKSLAHALLTAELFKQLRFPIKAKEIKPRIESLIERDYLKRSETDAQIYEYLA